MKIQHQNIISFRRVSYHKFKGISYTQEIYQVQSYKTNSGKTSNFICLEDHFLGHTFGSELQFFPHLHAVQTEEIYDLDNSSKDILFLQDKVKKEKKYIIGVMVLCNFYVPGCLNHYFYQVTSGLLKENPMILASAYFEWKTVDKKNFEVIYGKQQRYS
eukprot:TRINITY_DN49723_c0_g1_i1.p1 TRINITY_DN49723_c0_g1~~TRINITY_DN49723_c0_g1_i1.p1  ORF type:complete len:159 (-),score=17.03 TRINITY_DN49723_c0_g1_i1:14-490(-)